jgi:hypothetical protein
MTLTVEERAALDEEIVQSPLRIEFAVILADGTQVASRCYAPQETWESMNPEERMTYLKENVMEAAKVICDAVEEHGVTEPV